ncbi:MAG: PD40 domain-containing protein, partial [Candidatus Aminicenantes bacterium]|nr:PD40 domain-containing protein [Candidatus Aminicenantes bacterium]
FALAATYAPAQYQGYFGRNKVQYKKFDYQVLRTDHFQIYFYPEEEAAVRTAAVMAERWYNRYARIFNHDLRGKQALILYASHPQFEQTTVLSELITEGTGGVTESFKRRIILPFGATLEDTDHIIGHELIHAFQYDMAAGGGQRYNPQSMGGLERMPLFLIEGAAEYFSLGPEDPHTAMWMRDMIRKEKIPTLKNLENPYKYFPYRYGQAVWAYIGGRWGDVVAAKLMKELVRGSEYDKAFPRILGITVKQFNEDWQAALKAEYGLIESSTEKPADIGRLLVQGTEEDSINCAPSISPDGTKFVFISSRDLFSIEMFMGDAKTGKVTRKLTKTAIDPHFQSIQFIYSAGDWLADGSRFAFGAVRKGLPVLAFLDSAGRRMEDLDVVFPELGEILNPTWSPDGRKIAFSALTGGYSDLYIYDFESKSLENITSDPYGDLQPAWSPDGKWIVFVTERYTAQLDLAATGNYRLALLDPETKEIRELPAFLNGKHITPQWSADGRQIYFISDRDGISNLYRLDRDENRFYQITNLYTGISGISSLSPSLTVASKTDAVLYGLYDNGIYNIYELKPEEAMSGKPVATDAVEMTAALLPPKARTGSELMGLLRNPMYGLPADASKFTSSPYEPKITLDYITPPQVGVGVDRYGSYAGGGVALTFSDMLGQHNVIGIAQVNSRLIDSAFIGLYSNTKNRLNYGFMIQRMPYMYGGYSIENGYVGNEPSYFVNEYIYRQIYYQANAFAVYPFNPSHRFELQAGYSYIQFANSLYTRAYSYYTNSLIYYEDLDLPAADGLSMPFAGAALVYDTSIFGATAPIIGQSYRFDVSPVFGTLNYTNVTADFRKYLVPAKPFTLAFRLLHFGRYGNGANDQRLYPMYLGYGTMIRGYEYNSFAYDEIAADFGTESFDYNRLFGTKMAVFNAELRFPLFGALGIGRGYYGIFPVDFFAFYDAAVAWNDTDKASFLGGNRKPLSSVGIGLRANILGYMILGFHYVKPLDRPDQGWHFAFSFWQGF